MKIYRPSSRGLTFSMESSDTYYPGRHYMYEVRKNCIIIRPSDSGMTVSRKKSGNVVKALFDIRKKEVRNAVSSCDYLQMEVRQDRIIVRCIQEVRSKLISFDDVMKELTISETVLIAAGMEGQFTFGDYLKSPDEKECEHDEMVCQELQKVFSVMSLFSGAGMLDWPFHNDPFFSIQFACDNDADACDSYRYNIGNHIVHRDIRQISGRGEAYNVIIGGPSCKPFSSSNRRKRLDAHEDIDLVKEYIRITRENLPDVFVLENVPQFISIQDGVYLSRVLDRLGSAYEITANIVSDIEIGGYTKRKRAVIIGSQIGRIKLPQKILHPFRTVKDAFAKISSDWYNFNDLTNSRPETIRRMAYVRQGHNYRDIPELRDNPRMHSNRYYRLDPDGISPTIVNWRKLPLIHPVENRTLSVAEASALMGFGKEFCFRGNIGSKQQQCGNGCTYAIGKLIKDTVKKALIRHFSAKSLYSVT